MKKPHPLPALLPLLCFVFSHCLLPRRHVICSYSFVIPLVSLLRHKLQGRRDSVLRLARRGLQAQGTAVRQRAAWRAEWRAQRIPGDAVRWSVEGRYLMVSQIRKPDQQISVKFASFIIYFSGTLQALGIFFLCFLKTGKHFKSRFLFSKCLRLSFILLETKTSQLFLFCFREKLLVQFMSTLRLMSYLEKLPVQQKHTAQLDDNYGTFEGDPQGVLPSCIPLFLLKIQDSIQRLKLTHLGSQSPEKIQFRFPRRT